MVEAALHEPEFGIDAELVEEIRASVTHTMLNGESGVCDPPPRLGVMHETRC